MTFPGTPLRFLAWVGALGFAAWAAGALYFDLPAAAWRLPAAGAFLLFFFTAIGRFGSTTTKLSVAYLSCGLVLVWWLGIKPRNDRDWQPEVAQTAWANVNGDLITIHNVRHCDYRTETDFTPRWETRTVRLSDLTGMDIAVNYWGSPWMAHPIVSFQFASAPPLCFSIETRQEKGESYSAIGGLYRQYELIYLAADERDVLRVRTNFREGEDVYLYRATADAAHARERFLEYIASLNELHATPRWYNAITTNCTTAIRTQHAASKRAPWDWRMLVNGKGDKMLYERGAIATGGLPFAELKERAHINAAAKAAGDAPDFSRRIRQGRPGF